MTEFAKERIILTTAAGLALAGIVAVEAQSDPISAEAQALAAGQCMAPLTIDAESYLDINGNKVFDRGVDKVVAELAGVRVQVTYQGKIEGNVVTTSTGNSRLTVTEPCNTLSRTYGDGLRLGFNFTSPNGTNDSGMLDFYSNDPNTHKYNVTDYILVNSSDNLGSIPTRTPLKAPTATATRSINPSPTIEITTTKTAVPTGTPEVTPIVTTTPDNSASTTPIATITITPDNQGTATPKATETPTPIPGTGFNAGSNYKNWLIPLTTIGAAILGLGSVGYWYKRRNGLNGSNSNVNVLPNPTSLSKKDFLDIYKTSYSTGGDVIERFGNMLTMLNYMRSSGAINDDGVKSGVKAVHSEVFRGLLRARNRQEGVSALRKKLLDGTNRQNLIQSSGLSSIPNNQATDLLYLIADAEPSLTGTINDLIRDL